MSDEHAGGEIVSDWVTGETWATCTCGWVGPYVPTSKHAVQSLREHREQVERGR